MSPNDFNPATEAVNTIEPCVLISSGKVAFAPKKPPLTLTPNSSSRASESLSSENSAKGADGFGDGTLVVGKLGYVTGAGDDRIAEFRLQLSGSRRDAVEHSDTRTLFDKARHHCPADGRSAARHQCNLTLEQTHG